MRPRNLSDRELIHEAFIISSSDSNILDLTQELAIRFEKALSGEHTSYPKDKQLELDFG